MIESFSFANLKGAAVWEEPLNLAYQYCTCILAQLEG